ncbi:nitronate monooxygenase [Clostridium sp. 19966]|uniref:NAD(P)H-dependent flavin oxidoreductase n=1 Tax=Clostridium sp. 19966 TaxID=2768166 RepID=UPI0028DE2702|nr:nitronate monooxygenase family protein [Clostridium sp. 19966]MDT8718077.1 nitronate monooxygenase [Clostridium sp. 19966]
MNINPLVIGDLVARLPIIQGGMGVGVSLSGLASAVAKAGGIGVISSAQIGFKEEDFETNTSEANIRALKKHIKISKENSEGGIIGVNIMVALKDYAMQVKAAIESGVDLIISGAGLPTNLPEYTKDSSVKIAPIVSSGKAANVILKMWDRRYGVTADLIIIEGPMAGGHLGFSKEDIEKHPNLGEIFSEVKEVVEGYSKKYNKNIPIAVAGGIYDGFDIAKYIKLGADGVQMATRFVTTEECDAHINFKKAYMESTKDTIGIVSSPVGMPGRAVMNEFVDKTKNGRIKVTKCYNCLTPCNPADTPYCITKALINAVNGEIDNGLVFCGENAYKCDKIVKVKDLMDELRREIEEA